MPGRLIYLALLMSVAGHSLGQTITKLNFNKDHLNKRLDGHVLELHTNVSLHQCSKECMLTLGCKSFNSQTSTNTCELNSVTVGDVGTGFLMVNKSWNYFDIDAWPREMVSKCHASMCPSTHRCVTGEPVPYCRPNPKPAHCAPPWVYFDNSCYWMGTTKAKWDYSINFCGNLGADLLEISSSQENAFVASAAAAAGLSTVWLSLNDKAVEGAHVWLSGEAVVFTRWGANEGVRSDEDCVMMLVAAGTWHDVLCGRSESFVCKKHIA